VIQLGALHPDFLSPHRFCVSHATGEGLLCGDFGMLHANIIESGSTFYPEKPSVPKHLASAGFILTPNISHVEQLQSNGLSLPVATPILTGSIPNPVEFGHGADLKGSMFVIKTEGSHICNIPAAYKPFLATLQQMIDNEYALAGDARDRYFAIRASRHTALAGTPHQSHIPDWHTHSDFGKNRLQIATDILGTLFKIAGKEVAAPAESLVAFDEATTHCTPTPQEDTRRTILVFMSLGREIANRRLRAPTNSNPLDILLGRQPYKSYNAAALEQHWHHKAQIIVEQQNKASPSQMIQKPLQFVELERMPTP